MYVHLRKLKKNLLEPKRLHVFPLNLQYQKVLGEFFKKKSLKVYDFHMILNSNVRSN